MGLLNRANLELAKLVPADESRHVLGGILVEAGETVVTNGHYLIVVSNPDTKVEDFPEAEGHKPLETFEPFMLPRKAALDILKVLPTAYEAAKLPITGHVAVAHVPEEMTQRVQLEQKIALMEGRSKPDGEPLADGRPKRAVLYTTNLENHQVFQVLPMKGTFPRWRDVVPDPAGKMVPAVDGEEKEKVLKPTVRTGVAVDLMAKIFAELKTMGVEAVDVRTLDAEHPVRFDGQITSTGQHVTVVLMPYQTKDIAAPTFKLDPQPVAETTVVAGEPEPAPVGA
jgi:hypothetical protein